MISKQSVINIIKAASGKEKADILFKNGKYVNVFTEEILEANIYVKDGYICAVTDDTEYEANEVVDLQGKILVPSFIDAHIHLESSMVKPTEFEKAVVIHGTQAVVCDPHEIANVAGTEGIEYVLTSTHNTLLKCYYNIPSCVPASKQEEPGAVLEAKDIEKYFSQKRVMGLAELMDVYSTVNTDEKVIDKEMLAINAKKSIDGHAPLIRGKLLNAYVASGVDNDHESSSYDEAIEKLKNGLQIFIREGTACKDLEPLIGLLKYPYYERCSFCCDDIHPNELIKEGHIDRIVRKAIKLGVDPIIAIKVASINTAIHYHIKKLGAIAPSYRANFFVTNDLKELKIEQAYIKGIKVAENGKCLINSEYEIPYYIRNKVYNSVHLEEFKPEDLSFGVNETKQVLIKINPGGIITNKEIVDCKGKIGDTAFGVDIDRDIVKVVNIERHKMTGHKGFAFFHGYGLKSGAVASTIAHDAHNLIVVGTNDEDMALCVNEVIKNRGGLCIVNKKQIVGSIALPIAGLLSEMSIYDLDKQFEDLKNKAYDLGVHKDIDPFLTLAFMALSVIPEIKITTKGLFDFNANKFIDPLF